MRRNSPPTSGSSGADNVIQSTLNLTAPHSMNSPVFSQLTVNVTKTLSSARSDPVIRCEQVIVVFRARIRYNDLDANVHVEPVVVIGRCSTDPVLSTADRR